MEFKNTKKIKVNGGFLQVANSVHPQFGESIAVRAIATKQKQINGKMVPVPDYDKKSTHFLSFNQASKLAAYLRTGATKLELDQTFKYEFKTGQKDHIRKILIHDVFFNKTINVSFENGYKVALNLNFDKANLAADLISQRMFEMAPEQIKQEIEDNGDVQEQEEIRHLEEKLVNSGLVTGLKALRCHTKVKMKKEGLDELSALKVIEAMVC